MEQNTSTLRATVRGYVQGVGFRVFVRSTAWNLGVRGYVRNMPDGTVQLLACGERPRLEQLLGAVWRGPAGAHVTAVDTSWHEGEVGMKEVGAALGPRFEVRH